MISLIEAVDVLNARKRAIGGSGGYGIIIGKTALLASGLDVDLDDVCDVVDAYIAFSCHALDEHDVERERVIAGCVVDGLLLGLILADLRAREQQTQRGNVHVTDDD